MGRGYPDFEGDKSGLYLVPEWAAKEGIDKNLTGSAASRAFDGDVEVTYTVPAAKELRVTHFFGACNASAAADGDSNQFCETLLQIDGTNKLGAGSNGGGLWQLNKPLVVAAGEVAKVQTTNKANHNCDVRAGFGGYEVDV